MPEPEPLWQKSSFSGGDPNSECVELAAGPGGTVLLRESDRPGTVLPGGRHAVRMLLARLKAGNPGRGTELGPTAGSRPGSGRCG